MGRSAAQHCHNGKHDRGYTAQASPGYHTDLPQGGTEGKQQQTHYGRTGNEGEKGGDGQSRKKYSGQFHWGDQQA